MLELAAVAANDDGHPLALLHQQAAERLRRGCLARSTRGQIAKAHHSARQPRRSPDADPIQEQIQLQSGGE